MLAGNYKCTPFILEATLQQLPSLKWLWCQAAQEGSTGYPEWCRRGMGPNPDLGGRTGRQEQGMRSPSPRSRDKAGPKDESRWEMDVFAALIPWTRPRHSLSATAEQTKPEVLRQTLHAAGKQGPSVPFNALISLILYLCSPSEERTHSGSFITALITAAGVKAPGCEELASAAAESQYLFKCIYAAINKSGLSLPLY